MSIIYYLPVDTLYMTLTFRNPENIMSPINYVGITDSPLNSYLLMKQLFERSYHLL